MENVIDLIATDASAHEISDAIKSALYAKAAERIEAAKPIVASSLFSGDEVDQEQQEK
jgi:hypothetical protein